jgi:aryl-alcohol dehydrogenase-like predicted oxidoreductase
MGTDDPVNPAERSEDAGDLIRFAGCDTPCAPLGVGTWAWGDRSTWGMGGYDADLDEAAIAGAWEASIGAGVTLFDTAEVYGGGESERIIGRLLARDPAVRDRLVIASKFMPSPWKLGVVSAMRDAARASLDRLGIERIDLYQIHGPISLRSHAALADALAAVHADGLVAAVGVSNYSVRETRSIHAALAERGLPLASNQIEFSALRRRPESVGLVAECQRLGVVPLAYSPIGQGRLTGKYSAANPPPGRRNFSAHPMEKVDAVVEVLRRIGSDNGDRTPAQVALRWLIEKGAVPIPGAKNADQAAQNAGALGWTMSPSDVAAVDRSALEGTRSLANRVWQHG